MSSNVTVKQKLTDLQKRATKRNISLSKSKSEEDVKVENDFFKAMENQIYAQIVRD